MSMETYNPLRNGFFVVASSGETTAGNESQTVDRVTLYNPQVR